MRLLLWPLAALWVIYVVTPLRMLGLNGSGPGAVVSYAWWRLRGR